MKDRLQDIMKFYEMSTYSFAQKIKVSHQTLSNNLLINKEISNKVIVGVANYCKEINLFWFITGNGNMIQSLKSDITEDNITMCMEKNGQYTTQIQSLEEQLRQTQIELLKTQADLIKCLKSNQ